MKCPKCGETLEVHDIGPNGGLAVAAAMMPLLHVCLPRLKSSIEEERTQGPFGDELTPETILYPVPPRSTEPEVD